MVEEQGLTVISDIAMHCDSRLSQTKLDSGERNFFGHELQTLVPDCHCVTHTPTTDIQISDRDNLHQKSGSH